MTTATGPRTRSRRSTPLRARSPRTATRAGPARTSCGAGAKQSDLTGARKSTWSWTTCPPTTPHRCGPGWNATPTSRSTSPRSDPPGSTRSPLTGLLGTTRPGGLRSDRGTAVQTVFRQLSTLGRLVAPRHAHGVGGYRSPSQAIEDDRAQPVSTPHLRHGMRKE
jgi:hypothetical protein